ncbi:MAG: type III pantothenate kinase [Bacteroidales bacterium]|nr:type III pantothenate kinase [Bacteroidales bacterium]
MNLVVDIGNTRIKLAIFDKGHMIFVEYFSALSEEFLDKLIREYSSLCCSIVSATGEFPKQVERWLEDNLEQVLLLSSQLKFPFEILYRTPHTLGNDRIAAVAAAQEMFPEQNCLIIDAGTAITFDFIDDKANYWGGNISPGLAMRFNALHTFTQKLPLIHQMGEIPPIGHSTETAIRSGVVWGIVYEIERYINEMAQKYGTLQVLLSGGDAVFLADKINYPIFVDEFLVLKGLNRILEYNVHK